MGMALKRIYELPEASDGKRVLVDRLWPRGITRAQAQIDLWMKDLAPSAELRKWFAHDPAKWPEFQVRYRAELERNPALTALAALARTTRVTLVYASRDEMHNNAIVLREIVTGAFDGASNGR